MALLRTAWRRTVSDRRRNGCCCRRCIQVGAALPPNTRRASVCWPAGAAGENQAGRGAVRGGGTPPGRAWWVAPSYKMAAVGWRLVRQLGQQVPGAQIKQADQMVLLPGGGTVQVRSADDPQSLRGEDWILW